MASLNSLSAFSRSIRRAAEFKSIQPLLRTVQLGQDEEITEEHRHREHENEPPEDAGPGEERDDSQFPGQMRNVNQGGENEQTPLLSQDKPDGTGDDSTGLTPLSQKLHEYSHHRVQELSRQREESRAQQKDEGREPLLIKKVQRDDGTEAEVIVGQSTLPQTIFNSSNVLIGVGMLSLPLGIRYAGWIIGLGSLIASSFITKYTAGLLAKCLDVDSSLSNFADIAYIAFGEKGRFTTSVLFMLELTAACVSLVILFADSLKGLIDGPDDVHWKILCGCILAPLNFLPMRWLSFTSFLGIFCGILLILVTFIAGSLKSTSPGSLLDVATTYAWPEHWEALPLSFGLIMG
jgi:solute carrier family 32 (vesicular inhibitory amino acid transporter)